MAGGGAGAGLWKVNGSGHFVSQNGRHVAGVVINAPGLLGAASGLPGSCSVEDGDASVAYEFNPRSANDVPGKDARP